MTTMNISTSGVYELDPTGKFPLARITMSIYGIDYRTSKVDQGKDYYELYLVALLEMLRLVPNLPSGSWDNSITLLGLPKFLSDQILANGTLPPPGVGIDPRYYALISKVYAMIKSLGATIVVSTTTTEINPTGLYLGSHSSTYLNTTSIEDAIASLVQRNPVGQLLNL